MILKNNSEDVKVLVRYFESLSIEDNLKLSIIVIQSDLIKLKIDKKKLVNLLKNFLCVFDKNYNKNAMISYKDNMDVFTLAKVMEMNEKEKLNFIFEMFIFFYYKIYSTNRNLKWYNIEFLLFRYFYSNIYSIKSLRRK